MDSEVFANKPAEGKDKDAAEVRESAETQSGRGRGMKGEGTVRKRFDEVSSEQRVD